MGKNHYSGRFTIAYLQLSIDSSAAKHTLGGGGGGGVAAGCCN